MNSRGTPGRAIEIVGGGLAGLSLGVALRHEDIPVTIYEAGEYPRHRVCGEFITGLQSSTIARLNLVPLFADALRHRDVAWFIGSHAPRVHTLPAPALGISRHKLDARLAQCFTEAGGNLRSNTRVNDRGNRPGRVFATGRRRDTSSHWLGLKVHARNLPLTRDLEMHLGEQCYVGLTRVEDGAVNVCGLLRRRSVPGRGPSLLLNYIRSAGLNALADRLASAHLDARSFCAVAALDFDRTVVPADGVWLGDAAAMIPPFTGNGMAIAFQSAESALDPLIAYARGEIEWPQVCRATNAALRGRFRVRLVSANALHAFLLSPHRQRCVAALARARLLPFGMLYAALH